VKCLALVGLLAALPSLAVADEPARVNAYTQPHVLRYAEAEDIASLNPALNSQAVLLHLSQLTEAYLFRFDRRNLAEPELATVVPSKSNGGVSADGKTITYHLRHNVKWSDGAPFDGNDVRFTFDVMNNKSNNVGSRDGFDFVAKIDVPDPFTVIVHLNRPYSLFIPTYFASAGGNSCILPKHLLGSLPNINTAPYNNLPVGIGPFRYTAWHRGENVEMEANPNYWRGLPKLKKIIFKIVPDRNTVLTQMQTGEIDLWNPFGGSFLARAQAMNGVVVKRHPVYGYNHWDFNLTRPVLHERVVRQALRLATDRQTLRDKVSHGVGILQESLLPAPYPGIVKLPQVAFDIAKANALLDGAGWKRGADGIRAKNGVRLSLEFASSSGSPDVDTQLELVRTGWTQIGVEMIVKRYQSSQLFGSFGEGGVLNTGTFDVIGYGTQFGPIDGLSYYTCRAVRCGLTRFQYPVFARRSNAGP
jgi:peptide/nickel transport system substrate-binding protein